MLNIGCHLSISKGFYAAGLEAVSIGANTFQFFTRNPRGGKAKKIDPHDVKKLEELMKKHQFRELFAHGAYTMNLASDQEDVRSFSRMIFKDDLERLKQLPEAVYIFHPGSHVGQGSEKGLEWIIEALNEAISENNQVPILLEGMSGKGSEVGGNLKELKAIMDGVRHHHHLGICLDTCHMYSYGLDIVKDLEGVLDEIHRVIGIERVKAVHLNDSKMAFGSMQDRHEVIGQGTIGFDAIVRFINHPKLKNLTYNLETPNEPKDHQLEIERLREAWVE